jgi:putative phosphoesterase
VAWKTLEKAAALAVCDARPLRIGVVADTHSALHPSTTDHLARWSPDAIVHAGDIGDLAVLDALKAVAPVLAVRGNIDERAPDLPDHLTIDIAADGALILRILVTHIAVNGPKLRADAARLARSRDASLVVCGHSHVPLAARHGELSVFNPGSAGPRRFSLPIVFGTIEVSREAVSLAHFECSTGQRWIPGRA